MVHVPSLPAGERLTLAGLSGVAGRYGTGSDQNAPRDQAVAAVREVSTDPRLLGIQAGVALADPQGISGSIVELLQAAGADMELAAQHAAEVRARLEQSGVHYQQP
jgi:hypothetical protein